MGTTCVTQLKSDRHQTLRKTLRGRTAGSTRLPIPSPLCLPSRAPRTFLTLVRPLAPPPPARLVPKSRSLCTADVLPTFGALSSTADVVDEALRE